MRLLLALATALALSAPAFALDWQTYQNARFGYVVDYPAGFQPGPAPENNDGLVFKSSDGTQTLRVYGGNVLEETFDESVNAAMGYATDAGWALSYQRVTPRWASYSGTRNGQILYARAIALCDGSQYASFELEYPKARLDAMNAIIDHMVASLKPSGDGLDC